MNHAVLNIVCFKTFSVKRKENDLHRKYRLFGGSYRKSIFYKLTDRTKLMIVFHLQSLGAERHNLHYLIS